MRLEGINLMDDMYCLSWRLPDVLDLDRKLSARRIDDGPGTGEDIPCRSDFRITTRRFQGDRYLKIRVLISGHGICLQGRRPEQETQTGDCHAPQSLK